MNCLLCEREFRGDNAACLCGGCAKATGERLARVADLYEGLAAFLAPGGRRPELVGSRPAEAPLPVSELVLDLRSGGGIVGILEGWRRILHEDLDWAPPVIQGSIEHRLARAVRGLTDNLLWIASSWPAAGAFAEELRDLERSVVSIVNPPERTIRLGHCPARVGDGPACGAVLRVPPGTADVRCPWCSVRWPPETWLQLAAAQTQEAS